MTSSVLPYFIETVIVSLFLYFYYLLFWKQSHSYVMRRMMLLLSLILSLLIPILSFSVQTENPVAGSFSLNAIAITADKAQTSFPMINTAFVIMLMYFVGAGISLFLGLKGILEIIKIRRQNKIEDKGDHQLVHFSGPYPTFTFLNTIYWNSDTELSQKDSEMVYAHELSHIQQMHSLDMIIIAISRSLFWFNPVIHLINKEMAFVHECLADREVLKTHHRVNYISLLANQTITNMQYQWINQFASVSSLKRMRAMKGKKPSGVILKTLLIVPLIALLFTTISCENNEENIESSKVNTEKSEAIANPDEMPSFNGGMEALISYLSGTIVYPENAKKEGVEGKVFVSFVVEKDGSIRNAEVMRGVNEELDAEAVRAVESMPKWQPAKKDGKAVRAKMTLPISFSL